MVFQARGVVLMVSRLLSSSVKTVTSVSKTERVALLMRPSAEVAVLAVLVRAAVVEAVFRVVVPVEVPVEALEVELREEREVRREEDEEEDDEDEREEELVEVGLTVVVVLKKASRAAERISTVENLTL